MQFSDNFYNLVMIFLTLTTINYLSIELAKILTTILIEGEKMWTKFFKIQFFKKTVLEK